MKRAVKAVTPTLPIFGVDSLEVEALRQLSKVVGSYLNEDVDLGELSAAYHQYQKIIRSRKNN